MGPPGLGKAEPAQAQRAGSGMERCPERARRQMGPSEEWISYPVSRPEDLGKGGLGGRGEGPGAHARPMRMQLLVLSNLQGGFPRLDVSFRTVESWLNA